MADVAKGVGAAARPGTAGGGRQCGKPPKGLAATPKGLGAEPPPKRATGGIPKHEGAVWRGDGQAVSRQALSCKQSARMAMAALLGSAPPRGLAQRTLTETRITIYRTNRWSAPRPRAAAARRTAAPPPRRTPRSGTGTRRGALRRPARAPPPAGTKEGGASRARAASAAAAPAAASPRPAAAAEAQHTRTRRGGARCGGTLFWKEGPAKRGAASSSWGGRGHI